ncbi:MAG TPA: hypothetical protein VN521_09055 [Negativicutes bacterium]|nr:hypothetical protein [Negativicutes bacterium]
MQIIFTANGLYFCGKAGDFRRFLAGLVGTRQPLLSEYIRQKLK